jgi:hypothetical protein
LGTGPVGRLPVEPGRPGTRTGPVPTQTVPKFF